MMVLGMMVVEYDGMMVVGGEAKALAHRLARNIPAGALPPGMDRPKAQLRLCRQAPRSVPCWEPLRLDGCDWPSVPFHWDCKPYNSL